MKLDLVRKELDNYDNIIKNMINFRMSLIPIVTEIKTSNNIPLFQGKREEQIYKNIENFSIENGVDFALLKNIYKLIIENALNIEENISENENISILKNKDFYDLEKINQEFQKLDNIIQIEIPQILSNIKRECEKQNLNINQISSLYYNNKIQKNGGN